MKKVLLVAMVLLLIVSILTGCQNTANTPKESVNKDEVKEYSDPLITSILTAINNKDYESFKKDFTDDMLDAFSEDVFNQLVNQFNEKIGSYTDNTAAFIDSEKKNNYVTALYNADYTKEKEKVVITFTTENVNGQIKVAGLYFTSPNLRKK